MIARGTRLDNTSSRNSESGGIEKRRRINGEAGEANLRAKMEDIASFPGLQSPNTVEGLVKLLRRMMSGRRCI